MVEAPEGHGQLGDFSALGLERLRAAGGQLDRLRSRAGLDLLDLVTLVQQELRLDIEVAANETAQLGQASLDAFAEQVASYLASDDRATLGSFLAWLAEAEQRDNLAPRSEDAEPGTVQILTIHGAKGLEWDVVAVPRLVEGELPGPPQSKRGWLAFGQLPNEFRGDSAELPVLPWRNAEDQKQVDEAISAFEAANVARHLEEQRRLIYVAVTRARHSLLLTGSYWSTQSRPRSPGAYLLELQQAGLLPEDAFPPCDEPDENPLSPESRTVIWPLDPLGVRRTRVEAAAAAVEAARERGPGDGGVYALDVDLLLAERARREAEDGLVELPARIPASRFKDFVSDPAGVAAQLRRPMPERPYRQTRLGTLFHRWVEERYGVAGGATDALDAAVAELDDPAGELLRAEALAELQATFAASEWADRAPAEVELEIHVTLAGQVVVCKLDAVYAVDDGRHEVQIVDWKTGKAPATPPTWSASSSSSPSIASPTRSTRASTRPVSTPCSTSWPTTGSSARSGCTPRPSWSSCGRRRRAEASDLFVHRAHAARPDRRAVARRAVEQGLDVVDRHDRPGGRRERGDGVAVHPVDQAVEHLHGVVHDVLVPQLAAVQ